MKKDPYNASVDSIDFFSSELILLRIKLDRALDGLIPGQYLGLGLGEWETGIPASMVEVPKRPFRVLRRPYSVSSSPDPLKGRCLKGPLETLEFFIQLYDGKDHLSPRLFNLKKGSRLQASARFTGKYNIKAPDEFAFRPKKYYFLSSGTGEAPNNAMVSELLKNSAASIIVVHENPDQEFSPYRNDHIKLNQTLANYSFYNLNISNNEKMEDFLSTLNPQAQKDCFFISGDPAMIGVSKEQTVSGRTGVLPVLESLGFSLGKGNLTHEKYWN